MPVIVVASCGSLFGPERAKRRWWFGAAVKRPGAELEVMSKRIVLIDRDNIRRAQLRSALWQKRFEVTEFESGKDALKHLLFSSVSAVLLDYGSAYEPQNPVPAGRRIVREITDVDAFVPLILICDRCETLDHETSAAVDLIIRRPATTRQLIDGVQNLLGETLRERAQRKSGYIFAFR